MAQRICRPCGESGIFAMTIFSNGSVHVVEVCPKCRANLRTTTLYVPHAEVVAAGVTVETLPLHRDYRRQETRGQPMLF